MRLDIDLESIQSAFTNLQLDTKKSLEDKQKKQKKPQSIIEDLAFFLLGFLCKRAVYDREVLLNDHRDDLKKAKSIHDIFVVVQTFTSFLDYHILEEIIKNHGEPKNKKNLANYTKQLNIFLQNWKVEPLHVKKSTKHQTKWKYKLKTYTLHWYKDLQEAIAKFLKIDPSQVVLLKIKPGCVELVFGLPTTAVERFPSLTLPQIAEVAEWTPTVLNVMVLDGPLKDKIIYEVSFQTDK